jgi:uncharacterized protein YjaG (DUF416 family)
MKQPAFDRRELETKLEKFGSRQQAAFAALCAERLLPYYRWFSRLHGWGNYDRLTEALDAVWLYVKGPLGPDAYREFINRCEDVTPDTEHFNSPLASRALDASASVIGALQMCIEPSARMAAEVAELAVDAAFGVEQIAKVEDLARVRIADRSALQANVWHRPGKGGTRSAGCRFECHESRELDVSCSVGCFVHNKNELFV